VHAGDGIVAEEPALRNVAPVDPLVSWVPERVFASLAGVVRDQLRLRCCLSTSLDIHHFKIQAADLSTNIRSTPLQNGRKEDGRH